MKERLTAFIERGIKFPLPDTVWIGPEVSPDRFFPGSVIYPGCRLTGATLSIGPDNEIGREGPVSIHECQTGRGVKLGGGFFDHVTLLDGVRVGAGAHLRFGTLLEEQCGLGMDVGFKQTVLMPWATTGSLVNFCDALLSGGTGPLNHSEIGSSFVHFNFTPRQDKATPSLFGDVTHAVFLDQPPVFLGGQGGVVGPRRVAFGAILPAGSILREDIAEAGLHNSRPLSKSTSYHPAAPKDPGRIYRANLAYLGQLLALKQWYRLVRGIWMQREKWQTFCHTGALMRIGEMRRERFGQLRKWLSGLPETFPEESWEPRLRRIGELFETEPDPLEAAIRHELETLRARDYLEAVREFSPHTVSELKRRLTEAVQRVESA